MSNIERTVMMSQQIASMRYLLTSISAKRALNRLFTLYCETEIY